MVKVTITGAPVYGGFGKSLLEKLGWSSGKGLGKNEDGVAEALRPKKKEDQAGIGGTTVRPWSEKAWEKQFAAALSGLPGEDIADSDSGDDSSDSGSESESEPPAAGLGGSRGGAKSALGGAGRDGIASSATVEEAALAKALAKDKWGRFGGRDGKMARIAAAEAQHFAAVGGGKEAEGKERKRHAREASAAAEAAAAAAAAEARRLLEPPSKRVRGSDGPSEPAAAAADAPASWWSSIFHVSRTGMGAAPVIDPVAEAKAARARAFRGTEAEQQALCAALDAAQPAGKRGLGRRAGGGAAIEEAWKGTKRTFDEAEADGAAEEDADDDGLAMEPLFPDHAAALAATARESPSAATVEALKWKKLASGCLSGAGGALSERKLRKAVLAAALAKLGCEDGEGVRGLLEQAFQKQVLGSSKFARTSAGKVQLKA